MSEQRLGRFAKIIIEADGVNAHIFIGDERWRTRRAALETGATAKSEIIDLASYEIPVEVKGRRLCQLCRERLQLAKDETGERRKLKTPS